MKEKILKASRLKKEKKFNDVVIENVMNISVTIPGEVEAQVPWLGRRVF